MRVSDEGLSVLLKYAESADRQNMTDLCLDLQELRAAARAVCEDAYPTGEGIGEMEVEAELIAKLREQVGA
jgi:hypothetical protein